jgi:hypothetical protein
VTNTWSHHTFDEALYDKMEGVQRLFAWRHAGLAMNPTVFVSFYEISNI